MDKTIAVVDDDPDILDALQFMLEDAGYRVETAEKGEYTESFEQKGNLPDLLILDVLLSGQDGRDIARKLKANEKTARVPIIMISAHPNIEKSVREVADDFVAKPFDIDIILAKVAQYIH